jgi:hypothetical protein
VEIDRSGRIHGTSRVFSCPSGQEHGIPPLSLQREFGAASGPIFLLYGRRLDMKIRLCPTRGVSRMEVKLYGRQIR